MHLGIAGAGIMGRVLAYTLVERGHRVSLFDSDPAGGGRAAAWTAAGMLAPWAELESAENRIYELGLRSLELWPHLVADLDADVDFHLGGSLVVAHRADSADWHQFRRRLENRLPAGVDGKMQLLDRDALAALEPDLTAHFSEALWLPGEAWLDTRKTMNALADFIAGRGVEWHEQTPVTGLEPGQIHTERASYAFDWVVDCRGLGSRTDLPGLRGVRGEVLWLEAPDVMLTRPVRLIHPRYRLYLVPRSQNRYVLGATQIESDDHGPVTVRSSLELLSAAFSLHPAIAEARVVHTEANCRPALDDNLPRLFGEDGLLRINGLFRHGYLLAPALAERAARYLVYGESGDNDLIQQPRGSLP